MNSSVRGLYTALAAFASALPGLLAQTGVCNVVHMDMLLERMEIMPHEDLMLGGVLVQFRENDSNAMFVSCAHDWRTQESHNADRWPLDEEPSGSSRWTMPSITDIMADPLPFVLV